MNLHSNFEDAAARYPDRVAVREALGLEIRYDGLGTLAAALRNRLVSMGIQPGDRVGIWLPKSIDAVASILGILGVGAAYVPVDPTAPASRNGFILSNCGVRAVVVAEGFADVLRTELETLGTGPMPAFLVLGKTGGGTGLRACLDRLQRAEPAAETAPAQVGDDDLAYILYTSGSTGKPKGVTISHRNACSFVEWCVETFRPGPEDCFSSHAPFHFDLSILDIYTALWTGARLVLVPEDVGKEPGRLAQLIEDAGITIWYSAPSILTLLSQYGGLQERNLSALRLILFAGEVFPLVHLRRLVEQVPHPGYWNLYGPTETNVCTAFRLPRTVPKDRRDPFPIGEVCSHLDGMVVDEGGAEVAPGGEGELVISGTSVTSGYWNLPDRTVAAFLDPALHGPGWYRSGDLVVNEGGGCLRYVGRRDRMVKKRGYRVELGEIEACLYRHDGILEAAVLALSDDDGVRIRAHLATRDGSRISLIKLKRFCSENLPLYMIPDLFMFHDSLPKTSTDKIDYQTLKSL